MARIIGTTSGPPAAPAIPDAYAADFIAAGHAYGIPPEVLAGVAQVESAMGANRGPSSAGAVGLMQFEPGTASDLGINPRNDREAIWGAAKYLHQLGYSADPVHALSSYNAGPAAAGAARAQGNTYAASVQGWAARFRSALTGRPTDATNPLRPGTSSTPGAAAPAGSGGFGGQLLQLVLTIALVGAGAALVYIGVRQSMTAAAPGAIT